MTQWSLVWVVSSNSTHQDTQVFSKPNCGRETAFSYVKHANISNNNNTKRYTYIKLHIQFLLLGLGHTLNAEVLQTMRNKLCKQCPKCMDRNKLLALSKYIAVFLIRMASFLIFFNSYCTQCNEYCTDYGVSIHHITLCLNYLVIQQNCINNPESQLLKSRLE